MTKYELVKIKTAALATVFYMEINLFYLKSVSLA